MKTFFLSLSCRRQYLSPLETSGSQMRKDRKTLSLKKIFIDKLDGRDDGQSEGDDVGIDKGFFVGAEEPCTQNRQYQKRRCLHRLPTKLGAIVVGLSLGVFVGLADGFLDGTLVGYFDGTSLVGKLVGLLPASQNAN